MPCTETELNIAKLDGCRILWLTSPKAAIGANGRLTGLICSRMRLGDADSSGRRSPVDTGEMVTLEVDMVIKAAGQAPFADLVQSSGLENDKGKIRIGEGGVTDYARVFAGGDCVNGGKEVVDAVQAGKDAAAAMLQYLVISIV
jgi:glutamate synthase (NADPH/NADH) small chain